jgi:protein gp37
VGAILSRWEQVHRYSLRTRKTQTPLTGRPMSDNTKIEWCDHTFNSWWGCTKVSQACKNCYAEAWAKRTGHRIWGDDAPRRFFGDKHWAEPLRWNREAAKAGVRRRVFCASMADVFERREELEPHQERLWKLVVATKNLDWMLLTKRPENVHELVAISWTLGFWPINAWLGVTFDDKGPSRLDEIVKIPAAKRFVSVEPLIKEETLRPWLHGLDLVIVGGESGAGARPMNEDWVRKLRDECADAGVAFFYKQRVDNGRKISLPLLDGKQWAEMPQ